MTKRFPVGRGEERVRFRGHLLQRVPEGPAGQPAFYIAVRPATNADYDFLARGAKVPALPREPRRAPRSWEGQLLPRALRDSPLVDIAAEDAAALAEWWQLRLPTLEEWQRAARAGLLGDTCESWAWTSTPAPDGGFFVCGGRFRNRLDEAPSHENVSFESRPAADVGVRLAADAGPAPVEDEEDAGDARELTLPPAGSPLVARVVRSAEAKRRAGPVVMLSDAEAGGDAIFVGTTSPAVVHRRSLIFAPTGPLAYNVLAFGIIARGQQRRFAAWREEVPPATKKRIAAMIPGADLEPYYVVAHEAAPGPSLAAVLHAIDARAVRVPAEIAAAVGVHLARAWGGLGLGRRTLALPEGGVLHPTPEEVTVGYGGRLLASPTVREWSKTQGPSAGDLAWGPPEDVISERAAGYSIAAIVFALLTGRSPAFRPADESALNAPLLGRMSSLRMHATARRSPLLSLRADGPPALAAVIDACLAVDQGARPATLADLATELAPLADPDGALGFFARLLADVWPEARAAELAYWESAASLPIPDGPPIEEVDLPDDPLGALESAITELVDYY